MYEQFIGLLGSGFADYPFLTMFIVSVLVGLLFTQIIRVFAGIFWKIGGW